MTKKLTLSNILLPFIASLMMIIGIGCNDTPPKNNQTNNLDEEFQSTGGLIKLNDRLFSIPSPLQVASLVKETGIPYNKELLNPVERTSRYTTAFKQALNLGVYGANLGYLNMYDQLPDAAVYFGVVKIMSKELGIMSSIDEKLLERFESNKSNKDSIMQIVSSMYKNADAYLMDNERNEIGIIILTGGWVESLYFLSQLAQTNKSQEIINRIGEQKYPLDNLIELLRPYYGKQSEEFDHLLEQLVDLATVFDGITIEYKYVPPTTYADKKLTVINSTTKTIIQDVQLNLITEQVEAIRNSIVQ